MFSNAKNIALIGVMMGLAGCVEHPPVYLYYPVACPAEGAIPAPSANPPSAAAAAAPIPVPIPQDGGAVLVQPAPLTTPPTTGCYTMVQAYPVYPVYYGPYPGYYYSYGPGWHHRWR